MQMPGGGGVRYNAANGSKIRKITQILLINIKVKLDMTLGWGESKT